MKIITLTPNPALDISTTVPQLVPERKMRCGAPAYHPGGGGINVARVIHRLKGQTVAVFPSGGASGQHVEKLLAIEGIDTDTISVQGLTRESFAVTESSSQLQYRFGLPGNPLAETEWQQLLHHLEKQLSQVDFLVASGSLPPGVPEDFYAQVASLAKRYDTKLVLDTSGVPLQKAVDAGVYLLKPNLSELASITGVEHISGTEQEDLAKALIAKGKATVIVVSMGARGAMIATNKGIEYCVPPTIPPKSTIGAGDSMVAGIVYALAQHKPIAEVLRYGVACGTATTMQAGTGLCQLEDVNKVLQWMKKNN